MSNVLEVTFGSGQTFVTATRLWQGDYGQILLIHGPALPSYYEVHFSSSKDGTPEVAVGTPSGVTIPNRFLRACGHIYAWVFLHVGNADGETKFQIKIPVEEKGIPIDQETPEEQTAVQQAIAALNEETGRAEIAAHRAEQSEVNAKASEDAAALSEQSASGSAEAAASSERNAAQSELDAAASAAIAMDEASDATQAANAAIAAANTAEGAAGSVTEDARRAETAANHAEQYSDAAQIAKEGAVASEQAAQRHKNDAVDAKEAAQSAASMATQKAQAAEDYAGIASQKAEVATDKALEASLSATDASGSASNAATSETQAEASATAAGNAETEAKNARDLAQGYATAANQSKIDAQTAKGLAEAAQTDAETAQGKAEDAQVAAETAQGLAETAQGAAEDAALESEGYAKGTQDGTVVESGSPYYQANAKYYKDQAEDSAAAAAASAAALNDLNAGNVAYDPTDTYTGGTVGVELASIESTLFSGDIFDYSSVTKSRWIIASEKWSQVSSSSKARGYTIAIPLGTKKVRITANANGSYIAFLKTYSPSSGATPDYSTGYGARITVDAGKTVEYVINSDMVYLYAVLTTSGNVDMTPTVTFFSKQADEAYVRSAKAMDAFYFDWRLGRYLQSDGTVDSNTHYALSYEYPVGEGQRVVNTSPSKDSSDRDFIFTVSAYSETTFTERMILSSGDVYTTPKNTTAIRISFGYPSSVTNAPTMSFEILDEYFKVEINGYVQPFGINTDKEHPVYVAIGPSTTEGLMYNANTRGISRYAYPGYVGRVLDLKAYNLGVSGTGLVCRESGDDNFMDIIYTRSDLISKARLVTIMYGYGNDVGINLPVGSYTDYYPYDEEGYHPTGAANVDQMISAGATVMGCLNWCIKWINEHYPYAQLLFIFGAPSLNRDRTVTMTAQSGSTGVAPYTLTFADPYDDPASGTLAYGIKAIGEELEKLKAALGIPMIDLYKDGCPFSWYSTYARKPNNQDEYALFGMANSGGALVWNSHPIDAGYVLFGKYLAGQIATLMLH